MNKCERRKTSKPEDGVDFISNLPDSILLLILSRLWSTKNIIQTSILSRRWRYLWTSIPSLDLESSNNLQNREFIEFVYWVLLKRSVDLERVRLCCSDVSLSTVQRWIHAIVIRNVKRLDLDLRPENMVMPHCLVSCASLEVLNFSLGDARLILPSFSGFPALKVLGLEAVGLFDGVLLKSFLESCPLLEDLTLKDCMEPELDLLWISCPKLKKLRILDPNNMGSYGCVKLSCPKLVFLELSGQVSSKFISERLYSLKESEIYSHGESIDGLFPGISHVESLKTDLWFLYECVHNARDPALPKLKTLDVNTSNTSFILEDLTHILKNCPELKSLNLTIENNGPWFEDPKLDEVRRITDPDLKWVEFFELNGEKPKIDIQGFRGGWMYIYARWRA